MTGRVRAVGAANLGNGAALFRGAEVSNGTVVLGFKTISSTFGLVDDDATLSMRLPFPLSLRFTELEDVEPSYRIGPWVGRINTLAALENPERDDLILGFSDGSFVWREQAARVEQVRVETFPHVVMSPTEITDTGTFELSLASITSAGTYDTPIVQLTNAGFVSQATSASVGEANIGSNTGSRVGVYANKVGVTLQFHSINAGSGLRLDQEWDHVAISVPLRETLGNYQFPTVVVGAGGFIESVSGRNLAGVRLSLRQVGDDIELSVPQATYVAASGGSDVVGSMDRLDVVGARGSIVTTGTSARISVAPFPLVGAISIGTGAPLLADATGTLTFRGLAARGRLRLVGTRIEQDTLFVSDGAEGRVVVQPLRIEGSVVVSNPSDGVLRLDGIAPSFPVSGLASNGTIGVSPLSSPTAFRTIRSGVNATTITQGDAITLATAGVVAAGTVLGVSYDAAANIFTVDSPPFQRFGVFDGEGGEGFGGTSTLAQYEILSPSSLVSASQWLYRRWRIAGPLTLDPGGASGPDGQLNDLIIGAPNLDTARLPSGVAEGTYDAARLVVDARGLVTFVDTASIPLPSLANRGDVGEGFVATPSDAEFRRLDIASPLELSTTSGDHSIVAALTTINVAALVQGNMSVNSKGLVTGFGPPASVSYPPGMKLWQIVLSAGEIVIHGPGLTTQVTTQTEGTNNSFWVFDVITLNFPSRVLSVSLYTRRPIEATHSLRGARGTFTSNYVGANNQFGPYVVPSGFERRTGSPAVVSITQGWSASLRNSGNTLDLMGAIWLSDLNRISGDPGVNRGVCTVVTL